MGIGGWWLQHKITVHDGDNWIISYMNVRS